MDLFDSLIASVPTPCKILDIGGRSLFWEEVSFFTKTKIRDVEITVLNLNPKELKETPAYIKSEVGDARNLEQFADNEFDVVFSNSVIEHVGDYQAQREMAKEVIRVGQRYFVQTPNFYFPVEAHVMIPFLALLI